jgi:hypothetical protein
MDDGCLSKARSILCINSDLVGRIPSSPQWFKRVDSGLNIETFNVILHFGRKNASTTSLIILNYIEYLESYG